MIKEYDMTLIERLEAGEIDYEWDVKPNWNLNWDSLVRILLDTPHDIIFVYTKEGNVHMGWYKNTKFSDNDSVIDFVKNWKRE